MKALTIRNVDRRLATALEREVRRRGESLNETVLELLRRSLGLDDGEPRRNGLEKLAGQWTQAEARDHARSIAPLAAIDPELWR